SAVVYGCIMRLTLYYSMTPCISVWHNYVLPLISEIQLQDNIEKDKHVWDKTPTRFHPQDLGGPKIELIKAALTHIFIFCNSAAKR
ncbi:hypothetical protein ACJX0J_017108, partial [Zea mays]